MSMNENKCLSLGGQPRAVAKLQAARPMPASTPVASFGGMRQLCSLGVNRSVFGWPNWRRESARGEAMTEKEKSLLQSLDELFGQRTVAEFLLNGRLR